MPFGFFNSILEMKTKTIKTFNGIFVRQRFYFFCNLVFGPRRVLCLWSQWSFWEKQSLRVFCQVHAEWSPRHQPNANFIVHFRQVKLRTLTTEHVVLRLLHYWRDAIKLTAIGVSFHYLGCRPFWAACKVFLKREVIKGIRLTPDLPQYITQPLLMT